MLHADPAFDPAPGSRRRWGIFISGCLGFFLSMFYRVSTAVIAPDLVRDLHLDPSQMGSLGAAFYYSFALSQLPLALALDRLGARVTITGLAVFGVAGAALFGLAQGYHHALLARLLMGLGMSGALMGVFALLAAWFPINRFGFVSGVLVSLGTAGNLLAATPLAAMAQALGWRGAFLCIAGVHALVAVAFWVVARDHPPGQPPPPRTRNSIGGLLALMGTATFWGLAVANFARYGFFAAIQGTWAGLFLAASMGLDKVAAGNVILMLGVGYMLGLPVCGRISDRWLQTRKWVVWPGNFLMMLLIWSVAAWGESPPLWLAYLTFLGLGLLCSPGQLSMAHIKELVPRERQAQAMTALNLLTMLGPGVFSQVLGLALEYGGGPNAGAQAYDSLWHIGAAFMALGLALYYFVPDSLALRARPAPAAAAPARPNPKE
ncbi:MAG: MFS transporter [Pseudomonadota bacterium]